MDTLEKVKARNSSGGDYECKYPWDFFVQCGGLGMVLSKKGGYTTAFFEAFPNEPRCFLRGEGSTVEEAEESCWQNYQKLLTCDHEMERRDRTDGYAYCKHCSYSSTVFKPLTKCCKCNIPTAFATDYKNRYYCKKHAINKPKNPNPKERMRFFERDYKRLPRKYKKLLKKAVTYRFQKDNIFGKVVLQKDVSITTKFKCSGMILSLLFSREGGDLIKSYHEKDRS